MGVHAAGDVTLKWGFGARPALPDDLELARLGLSSATEPNGAKGAPVITQRRYAGPLAHVGELEGLRVVHLTDLHFGRVTPERVQRTAVAMANALQPDLVVITGDFVCYGHSYLDQLVSVLSGLEAHTLGVLGNHDYWAGAGEVQRALARAGVELLSNAHTHLEVRGQRLQLVGLDDAYTGHADRERAVKGLRRDVPSLGLSHIAEEADGLWDAGVPLVLSGHTHAGQVTVAQLNEWTLGKLGGHRYVHGLYGKRRPDERRAGAVYVNAGIGASLVPVRLGERGRRELAVFELGAAPGAFEEHHDEQEGFVGRAKEGSSKPDWRTRLLGARQ